MKRYSLTHNSKGSIYIYLDQLRVSCDGISESPTSKPEGIIEEGMEKEVYRMGESTSHCFIRISHGHLDHEHIAALTIFTRHERKKIWKGQRVGRTGMWIEDNGCERIVTAVHCLQVNLSGNLNTDKIEGK